LRKHAFKIAAFLLVALPISAEKPNHLYLCRSPLLAFNFWEALGNLQSQGITVTPKITQEVCDGMHTDREPQCIRAEGEDFKPVGSGWGGALAMTDGKIKVWFHNPETAGWIHPDYYVAYVNAK
jgi:hypothetical protein